MIRTSRAVALAAVLAAALAAPTAARSATITVTTKADSMDGDGLCSLREAVIAANTNVSIDGECRSGPPGADTIVLGPGSYKLTRPGRGEDLAATGDLDLIGPLEIVGAGAALTTIDAAGIDRVVEVRPAAAVSITGVTITGGLSDAGVSGPTTGLPGQGTFGGGGTDGACGGGILMNAATLTVSDSRVAGNVAGAGGPGVAVTGPTGLTGRGGDGGEGGAGGGICQNGGTLTLAGDTISGNRSGAGGPGAAGVGGEGLAAAGGVGAGGSGGPGIGGAGGPGGYGGGVVNWNAGSLVVSDSTVIGNRAGNGGAAGTGTGSLPGQGSPPGTPGSGFGNDGGQGGVGGGIGGNGPLTVTRSLITANVTGTGGHGGKGIAGDGSADGGRGGQAGDGGGVGEVSNGSVRTFSNVTITGNLTGGGGGAGGHSGGLSATSGAGGRGGMGGGIASEGTLNGAHLTVSGNGAGSAGSLAAEGGTDGALGTPGSGTSGAVWSTSISSLTRSIFSGNACDTTTFQIDGGQNIAFQASGCAGAALDPRLGPLADNGGPTKTLKPGAGSPALDRIPAGLGCPATDQRGAVRPSGAGCDVGAFEVAPPTATTGPASALTGTTAVAAGTLDTRGLDTGYRVEFGPTTAYGRQVAATVTGAAKPSAVTAALTGLTPLTTYHYRLVATGPDGTSAGADHTLTTTTAASASGGPGGPRVAGLSIAPKRFGVVPRGGKLRSGTRTLVALGATIRFRLSEGAAVRITVQKNVTGHRVRRKGRTRCVAATGAAAHARAARCVLHRRVGLLHRTGVAGPDHTTFLGRIGRRALAPGSYRLVVVAVSGGASSTPVRAGFRIVSRR